MRKFFGFLVSVALLFLVVIIFGFLRIAVEAYQKNIINEASQLYYILVGLIPIFFVMFGLWVVKKAWDKITSVR